MGNTGLPTGAGTHVHYTIYLPEFDPNDLSTWNKIDPQVYWTTGLALSSTALRDIDGTGTTDTSGVLTEGQQALISVEVNTPHTQALTVRVMINSEDPNFAGVSFGNAFPGSTMTLDPNNLNIAYFTIPASANQSNPSTLYYFSISPKENDNDFTAEAITYSIDPGYFDNNQWISYSFPNAGELFPQIPTFTPVENRTLILLDNDQPPISTSLAATVITGTATDDNSFYDPDGDGTLNPPPTDLYPTWDGDLVATANTQLLDGLGGDDILRAGSYQDILLIGGIGNDTLNGESATRVHLQGGSGHDVLWGSTVDGDYIEGGSENDFSQGHGGNDVILGQQGDDWLGGNAGTDHIEGGVGADRLFGGAGADSLDGGDQADILYGDSHHGRCVLDQTTGIVDLPYWSYNVTPNVMGALYDVPLAEAGDDYLSGGSGLDTLYGGGGHDILDGGADNDTLEGEGGDDQLFGGAGDDTLWGDSDPATVAQDAANVPGDHGFVTYYGRERDVGPDGNDTLDGGTGNDQLHGGAGDDTYLFGRGYGEDTIQEESGTDIIKLGPGILPGDISLNVINAIGNTYGDLVIAINGTTDTLTVRDWFGSHNSRTEFIQFADGTLWDAASVMDITGHYVADGTGPLADSQARDTAYQINTVDLADNFQLAIRDSGGTDTVSFTSTFLQFIPEIGWLYNTPVLTDHFRDGNDHVLEVSVRSPFAGVQESKGQVRLIDQYTVGGEIERIELPGRTLITETAASRERGAGEPTGIYIQYYRSHPFFEEYDNDTLFGDLFDNHIVGLDSVDFISGGADVLDGSACTGLLRYDSNVLVKNQWSLGSWIKRTLVEMLVVKKLIWPLILLFLLPKLVWATEATQTKHYKLIITKGKGNEACQAYKKNLDYFNEPMACERYISPGLRGFSKPKWTQMDAWENRVLLKRVERYLGQRYMYGDSQKNLPEWERILKERIKYHHVSLYRTKIDIDNDGDIDNVMKYVNGHCRSTHFYGTALFVLNQNMTDIDSEKSYYLGEDDPRYFGYMMLDIFLYHKKSYFDHMSDNEGMRDTLGVFILKKDRVQKICEYHYVRSIPAI